MKETVKVPHRETVEIPYEDAEALIQRIFKAQEKMDEENQGGSQEGNELYMLLHDIAVVLDSALEGC